MRNAIWLAWMSVAFIHAQPASVSSPPKGRPLVGLALAGGGAKGIAHIGVLRWLEEHRIPIDAIAGTSMGGLVGGLYASGRSADELARFVRDLNWELLLANGSGYQNLNFRRKEDQRSFPASLEFGLRGGVPRLPEGLNAGHQIQLLFDQIGQPYSEMRSFDELPTPFRCVATDLVTGNKVVFKDSSLARALRATMSLPAIFAPVAYDGMLLVDGAIVDNLPADIVHDMGADVVIAVDLGLEKIEQEQKLSLLDVVNRSLSVMIRRNELVSLKSADIVIAPKVDDIATLAFEKSEGAIQRGYEAAENISAKLTPYALNESDWNAYRKARAAKVRDTSFTPEFVEVEGTSDLEQTKLADELRTFIGRTVDRKQLEQTLTRFTGRGLYQSADYRRVDKNGKTGLLVSLKKKAYGPPFLRPLVVLDSGQSGAAGFTIAGRILAYDFPFRRSEIRTDLSFGRVTSFGSEYYQFVGSSRFFVAPRVFASRELQVITSDGARLVEYRVRRAGGGVDVGYNSGRHSEIRLGYEAASLDASIQVGSPILPDARGAERIWTGRWSWNSLNSGLIPTSGYAVDTQANWQFDSPKAFLLDREMNRGKRFGQSWGQLVYARPLAPAWSGLFRLLGGGSFAGNVQPFSEFRLGGPLRLGALEIGELRGANVLYGSAAVLRRFQQSPGAFIQKMYGLLMYETGDAFDSRLRLYHSGTAGVVAETNLGIVTAAYSYGERGRGGFFFSIGRIFDVGGKNGGQLR